MPVYVGVVDTAGSFHKVLLGSVPGPYNAPRGKSVLDLLTSVNTNYENKPLVLVCMYGIHLWGQ